MQCLTSSEYRHAHPDIPAAEHARQLYLLQSQLQQDTEQSQTS